jgi:hypothetical protein
MKKVVFPLILLTLTTLFSVNLKAVQKETVGPFEKLQACSYARFLQMDDVHMSKCYQIDGAWFYDRDIT